MSIAACYNVFNDAAALRGSLELSARFFDNIFVIHSSPNGRPSTDGTMELLEEFGIKPVLADMNVGFGVIRSRLIHECGCSWAFIMDADERFYPSQPVLVCKGTDRYPAVEQPDLEVIEEGDLIYQGQYIKDLIQHPNLDAIKTIRRHWFDFSFRRPTENWEHQKDWQLRIVRNIPEISYRSDITMHEQIIDSRSMEAPRHYTANRRGGPFHDHFHMFFRRAHPGHKERNEENYARLSRHEDML